MWTSYKDGSTLFRWMSKRCASTHADSSKLGCKQNIGYGSPYKRQKGEIWPKAAVGNKSNKNLVRAEQVTQGLTEHLCLVRFSIDVKKIHSSQNKKPSMSVLCVAGRPCNSWMIRVENHLFLSIIIWTGYTTWDYKKFTFLFKRHCLFPLWLASLGMRTLSNILACWTSIDPLLDQIVQIWGKEGIWSRSQRLLQHS